MSEWSILKLMQDERINKISDWLGSGSINIFGRPFAGKDAQGIRLAKTFNGHLIGGGEILRTVSIPDHVNEYIRQGKLIPSDDYVNIVLPFLKQEYLAGKPLILSSLGRWHGEETGVMNALEQSGHPLKAVIYLDISNNESHTRWLAREINNDRTNRHDDTEEILNVRFQEFDSKTVPVLDYYEELGLLIKINGAQSREAVNQDIIAALAEFADR